MIRPPAVVPKSSPLGPCTGQILPAWAAETGCSWKRPCSHLPWPVVPTVQAPSLSLLIGHSKLTSSSHVPSHLPPWQTDLMGKASVFRVCWAQGQNWGTAWAPQPYMCSRAVNRRVPRNTNWETTDKTNSRGAPALSPIQVKTRRPSGLLGWDWWGRGGATTPPVTHGSPGIWQGSSRHCPHFPDEEAARNTLPSWRVGEQRSPGHSVPAPPVSARGHPEARAQGPSTTDLTEAPSGQASLGGAPLLPNLWP